VNKISKVILVISAYATVRGKTGIQLSRRLDQTQHCKRFVIATITHLRKLLGAIRGNGSRQLITRFGGTQQVRLFTWFTPNCEFYEFMKSSYLLRNSIWTSGKVGTLTTLKVAEKLRFEPNGFNAYNTQVCTINLIQLINLIICSSLSNHTIVIIKQKAFKKSTAMTEW